MNKRLTKPFFLTIFIVMINTETLSVHDVITAYESAGFVNTENYTSITIRQLKFRRGDLYVDFNWKADDWIHPLKNGHIDVYVLGEASYSSSAKWADRHILPKELLYEASITIDSAEKLVIYLNNALIEKAIDVLE